METLDIVRLVGRLIMVSGVLIIVIGNFLLIENRDVTDYPSVLIVSGIVFGIGVAIVSTGYDTKRYYAKKKTLKTLET